MSPKPFLTLSSFPDGELPDGTAPLRLARLAGWSPAHVRHSIVPRGHFPKNSSLEDDGGNPIAFTFLENMRYPDQTELWPVLHGVNIAVLIQDGNFYADVPGVTPIGTEINFFAGNLYWVESSSVIGLTKYDTLNGAINNSVTSLTVDDASTFPTAGVLLIDSELIRYTGKSTNTLTGLTRGYGDSNAASHSDNAEVLCFDSSTLTYTNLRGGTFSDTERSPMLQFAGTLNIGYGRQIIKIEPGGLIITSEALVLGDEDEIVDMIEYNGSVYISVSRNGGSEAYIGVWDGVSESLSAVLPITGVAESLIETENSLFAFIYNSIWIFNGADFSLFDYIPGTDYSNANKQNAGVKVKKASIAVRQNQVLFVPSAGSDQLSFPRGIYGLGRRNSGDPYKLWLEYLLPESDPYDSDIDINCLGEDSSLYNALFLSYDTVNYFRSKDSSSIYVYNDLVLPYFLTNIIELNDSDRALVSGIRMLWAERLASEEDFTVKIYFRTDDNCTLADDTSDWTELGSLSAAADVDNINEILYGIYERAWKIQFKICIDSADSPTTGSVLPAIIGMELY